MFRRGFLALIVLTLILAGVPPRAAEETKIVILVSDNEADMAIARNVAELLNADVYTSPWGTYSAEVSAEILSSEPDRVIIIGGPVAVPEEYTKDFDEFGIPYERWYGETRYETNYVVIQALREEFPSVFERITSAVIANGRDALAIETYLSVMEKNKLGNVSILVLTDAGRTELTLEVLATFPSLREIRYAYTPSNGKVPLFPLDREGISSWAKAHLGNPAMGEMPSPVTRDVTYSLLLRVQNKTQRAEELLDGLQIEAAKRHLQKAKETLEIAWKAYNTGDYVRAYQLAARASLHADFVISLAYRELRTVYQGSLQLKLQMELHRLEIMVMTLERKGYEVSDVESLLQEAREALKEGDYSRLFNELLPLIKERIAEKTVRKHSVPQIPGHPGGRRGRP